MHGKVDDSEDCFLSHPSFELIDTIGREPGSDHPYALQHGFKINNYYINGSVLTCDQIDKNDRNLHTLATRDHRMTRSMPALHLADIESSDDDDDDDQN